MSDPSPDPIGRPARIAVIGSGPSGFYAIAALFKQADLAVEVDLFDRLPTPFGLVRGGVAPDHQNIKAVARVFNKLAADGRFRFFGNVLIGRDVTADDLIARYDQIIFATGNESERKLGIPGEELTGVHSATEFVGWYNGHPDFRDLTFDLESAERVVVVGNGNVSMDVTRILAKDPDDLAATDIAAHALEVLRRSQIREILILGRRGPAQAAFTPKEIQEIGSLTSAELVVDPEDMKLDPVTLKWMAEQTAPSIRKNIDYLTEKSLATPSPGSRRINLDLLVSPIEFIETDGRLSAVRLENNELYEAEDGTPRPRGTGIERVESIQMAFTAVGYRGVPIPGVPFDERKGTLANDGGRIVDSESGEVIPGQYVVGWAKRGPQGLIGSNVADAKETVERLLRDLAADRIPPTELDSRHAIVDLLSERGVDSVSFADWQRLDDLEIEAGEKRGKIREKLTRVDEMIEALRGSSD